MPDFPSTELDSYILDAMRVFDTPGLSLSVIQNDRVLCARGYGARKLGGEPVNEHTSFAIGSISKSFTSTALGMLVDEGRLGWDDPVRDYLSGFQMMDPFANLEMRVRDLLVHHSGLPEVSGGTIWYGSDLGREEVVERIRFLRPSHSFRSHYAYQNIMYLAAGLIIPAVTGQSWDDFITERIFRPLGMRHSAPTLARARSHSNQATPYIHLPFGSASGPVHPVAYRDHDNIGPAGAIHSTAWDLAQYLRMHLAGGSYEGQRLLQPETAAELHAPQVVMPRDAYVRTPPGLPQIATYALGWRVQDYRGMKMVQHSGGVDGMRALATMLPGENLGVVVLTNIEPSVSYAISYKVMDSLLGAPDFDWAASMHQANQDGAVSMEAVEKERLSARTNGTRPSLPLAAYTGRYPHPLVDWLEVAQEAGRLTLRFAHTPAFTADLEHWHYDTFRLNWRDPYIPWGLATFTLDSRGRVDGLKLDQPNLLDVDFRELGALPKGS